MVNVHKQIFSEVRQDSAGRKALYQQLEQSLDGRALVSFFTSFLHPVSIDDEDCDMLQSILQGIDTSNGIALMINSPGGDGLAAERIVNACRSYSGTGDYWVIVPGRAKSAATIISMGASKIMMPPTAELGPVDPQVFLRENGVPKVFSAHSLVAGYDKLFDKASTTQGNLEPFLQQLTHYDDREIASYRSQIALSESIAVNVLRHSMMSSASEAEIKERIAIFLNPDAGTLTHGRPIYAHEARECGLNIETIDVNSELWQSIYQLYARVESYVTMLVSKAVESREDSFNVQAPDFGQSER